MTVLRRKAEGYRRHPIWISIAVSALMLAILGAAELAARKYAPVEGMPDFAQYLIDSSEPFFDSETVRGREEMIQVPRHPGFPPIQRFALDKPAGLRRIVVIGESSAMILGWSLSAVAARNRLSQRIEIINMAVGGSDLEQTMRRFREALQYAPNAIIVLFGHNLFLHHPTTEISGWPGMDRLRIVCLKSRLVSLLVEHRAMPTRPVGFQTQGRLLAFRESLSKMADEARRRGVRLALCTAPGNLHFPPRAEELVRWAPEFLEIKYLYWTGERDAAMRKCQLLLSHKPKAWWNFQLGEWLYQAGQYEKARRQLLAAQDGDTDRIRAITKVNALIRAVSREKGLVLLDFDKQVFKSALHGVPGWRDFMDSCHLRNVEFEAAECLRVLGEVRNPGEIPKGFSQGAPRQSQDKTLHSILGQALAAQNGRQGILMSLAQTYLSEFLVSGEEAIRALRRTPRETALLLSYVGEAFWTAGHRARAMRLNDEARRLASGESELCLQRALFHLGSGEKTEAARWLRLALKLRPDQGEVRFYLSKLEAEGSA